MGKKIENRYKMLNQLFNSFDIYTVFAEKSKQFLLLLAQCTNKLTALHLMEIIQNQQNNRKGRKKEQQQKLVQTMHCKNTDQHKYLFSNID